MASALDKQLNEYRTRPKDESGARLKKESLIYDPREASFIDADTIFQIGFQGFTKLCTVDDRFSDFGNSIFSYNNIQIDPIFLTSPENQSIFEKVENLLYLLSDYILRPEAVQVLEYLIRQFAVNRLRPSHLILVVLPYLETSFFVRVIQTIPFKDLPYDFKFLKDFQVVKQTKKPINRSVLRDMIESRSDLLHWIIKNSYPISEIHPNGAFVSFVGILFTEIGLNTTNEVILISIIDTCRSSFSEDDKSLAPHLLMSVAAINEKRPLSEKVINKFTELVFNNSQVLLHNHFRSMLMAAIYFLSHSNQVEKNYVSVEFITELGNNFDELDEISKQYKMKPLAEKCIQTIALNLDNEDLIRSSISILETDFFYDVVSSLISEICQNFVHNEYSENLIQSIASHYPTCLTSEIVDKLSEFDIKINPSQLAPRNLISKLSNPEYAASLYSNPELPFDVASSQVISSLEAAYVSENPQPIIPIIDYFSSKEKTEITDKLIQYLCRFLFIDESSQFSVALNSALSSKGVQLAPFFESLPSNNSDILDHLIKCVKESQLPNYHVLPFALARSLYNNDPVEALEFLPIKKNFDYSKLKEILENSQDNFISVQSDEEIAATILKIANKIFINIKENKINISDERLKEAISLLLNFPSILIVAPILKNIEKLSLIIAVFEETGPKLSEPVDFQQNSPSIMKKKRIRMNYIYYLSGMCQKIEDPMMVLPTLYMALLSPELVSETTVVLRSIPRKNKEMNFILTKILRQKQIFEQGEESLRSVLSNACKEPTSEKRSNNREFFDQLWKNIQTARGCSQFWRITEDLGICSVLKKFEGDSDEIPDVLQAVLNKYPDNEQLISWGYNSLRPPLMRASIPYLPLSEIKSIVPVVCAYPKYFSPSFYQYFISHEIDCKILIPFLEENSVKLLQKSDVSDENEMYELPPEKLKLNRIKSKYIILPATLILEVIPMSSNLSNLSSIVPSLFEILKLHKLHYLIFPILMMCIYTSSDYMIKNFSVIVDTLSHSPIPHIHVSALNLVKELASRDPSSIANHATSLFTALSGSTVFQDDTANLLKIKQLLSAVLPVLSQTENVDQLLDYFSQNIDHFSFERATQLIIHSIDVLGENSYKVFYSLLKAKKVSFSLLIIDQIKPHQLMQALIYLLEQPRIPINENSSLVVSQENNDNDEIIAFILQIALPPLPYLLKQLFEILMKRIEIEPFVESTLQNFSLQDFIKAVIAFLPSKIAIYSILDKKLVNEQSPLFIELLEPLAQEISEFNSLDTNLMILIKIWPCLTAEQSPSLIPIIELLLSKIKGYDEFTLSNQVQALCFMASSIERFDLTMFQSFNDVIEFAVDLYQKIIKDKIDAFISNATASICLLIKSSVYLCIKKLPELWKLMISPIVIERDVQLYKMVKDSMFETTKAVPISPDILMAFFDSYKFNEKNYSSIILLFEVLSNNLKNSEHQSIKENNKRINTFFFIGFANKVNTNANLTSSELDYLETNYEEKVHVQDSILESFCVFLSMLSLNQITLTIRKVLDFFGGFMKLNNGNEANGGVNKVECISYRIMFARLMIKVTNGLEKILNQFYEELLQIDINQLLMAKEKDLIDDSNFLNKQLTMEALSLFVNIQKYAPDQLFNADYFNQTLNAIILHVTPVKETQTQDYVDKIVGGLAPSFAALIDSTRKDELWRVATQKIIELTRSPDYRVKVAALQMISEAFEVVEAELTPILPEIAPSLYELTEDSNNGVDKVARKTISTIEKCIDDELTNYFS